MLDKFRKFFKDKQDEIDEKYVFVPENEINEELKSDIIKLERLGEELSKVLQRKYANIFESLGKQKLRIWVCRDIDGDEEDLTSESCLEKEYRAQIAIDYDDPKFDDEWHVYTIELWYCFGGHFKSSGTLYNWAKYDLEKDIEEALKMLLLK